MPESLPGSPSPGAVVGAAAASPTSDATTTMRCRAEYFGWHAVSVSRLSPKSSSTSTWSGLTMSWRCTS